MTPLLQVAAAVPTSPLDMVRAATPMTKGVLVLLVVLSLVSWGIMLLKWREYRAVEREGDAFVRQFEDAATVSEVEVLARTTVASPFTRVFARAQQFLQQTTPALGATHDRTARLSGSQVEALRLVLDAETNHERDALGRFVPWLATIGSVSPLIGLLGTVLGVISAFIGIATKGSGNIGAVAPGIAEALIATAAALAVAIPAAFGYNILASKLNRFDGVMERFNAAVIARFVREGQI